MNSFSEKLDFSSKKNSSILCVGLDIHPNITPQSNLVSYAKKIIRSTNNFVCAYKINLSFFEIYGSLGIKNMEEIISFIKKTTPHIPIVGDGKRGDISSSSEMYAKAIFDTWKFDACTINAFAGEDSIKPFLNYKEKGIFIWCKSSNPSSKDLQDLNVIDLTKKTQPFYKTLAQKSIQWNQNHNVGLVVGGTYHNHLKEIQSICPNMKILVPGIGKQGGDIKKTLSTYPDNIIISSSRSIIYPENGQSAHNIEQEARKMNLEINSYR
ncbi:MAG: orotidine-5'-phosphate decarboxylase [SAR202 cluster bacterium]|nr:orotidine-5'-phosphate decarboxylase [SAR202 cluster bacterium]|tara:strand:- start:9328 stop:10128 length:801 start_codon:yes stop_codon:yes gene_type:complete